jgi:hypothetical protein
MLPLGLPRLRSPLPAILLLPLLFLLPLLHLGCSSDSSGGPVVPGSCDEDGDGFLSTITGCGGDDCDDTDPAINPDADEACSGEDDDDCDGFVDGDDAECAEVTLRLQDGAPATLVSNVFEPCNDVAHVQIDHASLAQDVSQPILVQVIVTYRKAIPGTQGNCPASPLGTTFDFPIPVDGELLIDNLAIVHQQHKLSELRLPPYPVQCVADIAILAQTESGDTFEVEPLAFPFTVDNIAYRNPPCPSQR